MLDCGRPLFVNSIGNEGSTRLHQRVGKLLWPRCLIYVRLRDSLSIGPNRLAFSGEANLLFAKRARR
jgi:hypothetical protein